MDAPSTGSTQCQAYPAITISKVRPAGPRSSNFGDLDVETTMTSDAGHPLVGFDSEHLTPILLEWPSGDPGAKQLQGSFEDLGARLIGLHVLAGDHVVEHQ